MAGLPRNGMIWSTTTWQRIPWDWKCQALFSCTSLCLDHCLDVLDMVRFVFLKDLLGVLEREPPPLSHRLLPLLLGVQFLHIEDKHASSVTLFLVFKLPEISAQRPCIVIHQYKLICFSFSAESFLYLFWYHIRHQAFKISVLVLNTLYKFCLKYRTTIFQTSIKVYLWLLPPLSLLESLKLRDCRLQMALLCHQEWSILDLRWKKLTKPAKDQTVRSVSSLQRTLHLLLLPGLDTDTGGSHLESVRVIYTRLEWLDFTWNYIAEILIIAMHEIRFMVNLFANLSKQIIANNMRCSKLLPDLCKCVDWQMSFPDCVCCLWESARNISNSDRTAAARDGQNTNQQSKM